MHSAMIERAASVFMDANGTTDRHVLAEPGVYGKAQKKGASIEAPCVTHLGAVSRALLLRPLFLRQA